MIRYYLPIKNTPGVGLAPTQIFGRFDGLHFCKKKNTENTPETPDGAFALFLGFVKYLFAVENLLIGVLVQ